MDYEVKSYEGAGPIKLGITPSEAVQVMGKADAQGDSPDGSETTYQYQKKGIMLTFPKNEKLGLIEFVGPDVPVFNGENLLELEDPGSWLEEQDEDADADPPDLQSDKLGISFYIPEDGPRCVGIFAKGYYDAVAEEEE